MTGAPAAPQPAASPPGPAATPGPAGPGPLPPLPNRKGTGGRGGADRLPPALVQGIGLRVSVIGTRGKATLAGLATAALRRRGLTVHCSEPRPPRPASVQSAWRRQAAAFGLSPGDHDEIEDAGRRLRAAWPVQALVLANRARSADGMRRLHAQVCMPHYALLTNLRRDPSGLGNHALPAEARRLVRSITPGALVICGEPDPALRALLRRETERAGLVFLDAAPRRATPAGELLSVLDAFLMHRFGKGLDPEEEAQMRRDLEGRFRWAPSSIPGVRWFHGATLHDVDTSQIVLNHLQAQRRLPVTFVVYLSADRPGRTRAYEGFLAELLAAPDTRQVILCGHRAEAIAERLERWGSQVRVVPDDVDTVPRLVRRLQFDCQGGAIVTLANDVGPWPEELARQLQRPTGKGARADAQAAAAAAQAQALVPRRTVRPVVAAAPMPSAQVPSFTPLPPPMAAAAVPLAAAAAALPSAMPSVTRPAMSKAEPAR